jgi:hypothetical protein
MLTGSDLRWNYAIFRLASHLCLLPVMFDRRRHGDDGTDHMETTTNISIWRKVVYKMWYIFAMIQIILMVFRTGQSIFLPSSDETTDWNFMPVNIIFCFAYYLAYEMTRFVFAMEQRELNTKVYNEIIRIRQGKNPVQTITQ